MLSVSLIEFPEIGPSRLLIQTGHDKFIDTATGEKLSVNQVIECMNASKTPDPILDKGAQAEILPHYAKIENHERPYYQFLLVNLPEVTKENRLLLITKESA